MSLFQITYLINSKKGLPSWKLLCRSLIFIDFQHSYIFKFLRGSLHGTVSVHTYPLFHHGGQRPKFQTDGPYDALDALREADVLDNTIIIATSDHGDMMMTHNMYYKNAYFDPSSKVPLIISGGKHIKMQRNVIRRDVVASLLDIFPTIMDMTGINWMETTESIELDGHSLMEFVAENGEIYENSDAEGRDVIIYDDYSSLKGSSRPNRAASQNHNVQIHLSWFMLREDNFKYIVYGTGTEVAPRLFDLKTDPLEMNDLAMDNSFAARIEEMDSTLKTIIDYPVVAEEVEKYNKDSFMLWRGSLSEAKYNQSIRQLRWKESWKYDSDGCFEAIDEWLKTQDEDDIIVQEEVHTIPQEVLEILIEGAEREFEFNF